MNLFGRSFFFLAVMLVGVSSARLGGALTLSDAFLGIAFLAWVMSGCRGLSTAVAHRFVRGGAVLLLVGGLLSCFGATDPYGSIVSLAKLLFALGSFLILGPSLFSRGGDYQRICMAICFSIWLNGIGTLYQSLTGTNGFGVEPTWGRMTGFSEHPNELGLHGAIGVLVAFLLARSRIGRIHAVIAWITLSVSIYLLIAAASMTAVFSVLIAGAVAALLGKSVRTRVRNTILGCVVLTAGVLLVNHFSDEDNSIGQRIQRQLTEDVADTTLGSRIEIYNLAITRIVANPLVGVGSSEKDSIVADGLSVHNTFLKLQYEGGIFQFLGMAWIFVGTLAVVYTRYKVEPLGRGVGVAEVAMFIGILVLVSFAPISYRRLPWVAFLPLVAFASARKATAVTLEGASARRASWTSRGAL